MRIFPIEIPIAITNETHIMRPTGAREAVPPPEVRICR